MWGASTQIPEIGRETKYKSEVTSSSSIIFIVRRGKHLSLSLSPLSFHPLGFLRILPIQYAYPQTVHICIGFSATDQINIRVMDLEVVGRHALLFDDDAAASFVNSDDALVDWNSLLIDRYDVRHLLSSPPPPRRRRNPQQTPHSPPSSVESELDHERFLDLPPPSDEQGKLSVSV